MQHAKRYKALLLDVDNTLLSFRPSSEAAATTMPPGHMQNE